MNIVIYMYTRNANLLEIKHNQKSFEKKTLVHNLRLDLLTQFFPKNGIRNGVLVFNKLP